MAITLSLAGITVTFDKFLDTEYPRATIQSATVEYSVLGSPNLAGTVIQPKFLWTINSVCSRDQRDLLEALAWEFHERRRNLQDGDILLYDTTATVKESNQRIRAKVPNTAVVSINNGSHVAYFGVFKAAITDGPKFTSLGKVDAVTLILTETIRTVP